MHFFLKRVRKEGQMEEISSTLTSLKIHLCSQKGVIDQNWHRSWWVANGNGIFFSQKVKKKMKILKHCQRTANKGGTYEMRQTHETYQTKPL